MFNINSRFRRLRRLADSYMDEMTLGELQEHVVQLMQRPRPVPRKLSWHYPPAPAAPPPPPDDPDGIIKRGL